MRKQIVYEPTAIGDSAQQFTDEWLKDAATRYAELNTRIAELDKEAKLLNAQLKDAMRGGVDHIDLDGCTLTYSVRKKESFNEEPMMEWMKSSGCADWAIKTREYIDMDELETAIYSGRISGADIAKLNEFKVTKETEVLTVKRGKTRR